ncbi:MAG: dihydrodipicolinate synthase family protein, partial [Oxalobacteraceae bacterium]
VRKHIMAARGMIASATVRRPGPSLSASDIADIALLTRRQEKRLREIGQPV